MDSAAAAGEPVGETALIAKKAARLSTATGYQAPGAEPQPCFVLYDRHIEKNAGSTMRVLMKRLEEHGECAYWGYSQGKRAWNAVMLMLQQVNASVAPPRLCSAPPYRSNHSVRVSGRTRGTTEQRARLLTVEAHTSPSASDRLVELSTLKRALQERGSSCSVLRSLRVRNPVSHYLSFFTWGVTSRDTMSVQDSQLFLRWANATPNLQTSILLLPTAGRVAGGGVQANGPSRLHSGERLRNFVQGWHKSAHSRLVALLQHVDLLTPVEEFDATLLLVADALGLHHIQHHTVNTDCAGTLSERVDLDDTVERHKLERRLTHCIERRAGKKCPLQMQSECEAVVRRVAPLDRWLYKRAMTRLRSNVTRAGPAFASRLRSFTLATHGVWRGGRPNRSRCKFVRLNATQSKRWRTLDFERHLCTPGPQKLMEEVTADPDGAKYHRNALIVPNEAECIASPLLDTCSVPRG